MLLVININNTNTMLGLFHNQKWIANWRVASEQAKLPDEYGMLLKSLFDFEGHKWENISGIAIASVVPPLTTTFTEMCRRFLKREPLVVTHEINFGVRVLTDYPTEVGADRILNALEERNLIVPGYPLCLHAHLPSAHIVPPAQRTDKVTPAALRSIL